MESETHQNGGDLLMEKMIIAAAERGNERNDGEREKERKKERKEMTMMMMKW